jgi:Excreted virulence factor EspC, type VII ESX diderm
MGTADIARVDTAAVRAIAREYETVAAILDARTHLDDVDVGGATAGRAYVAHGDALRGALADLQSSLRQWSRATMEIAAALRVSVDRYQDADGYAAVRLG